MILKYVDQKQKRFTDNQTKTSSQVGWIAFGLEQNSKFKLNRSHLNILVNHDTQEVKDD